MSGSDDGGNSSDGETLEDVNGSDDGENSASDLLFLPKPTHLATAKTQPVVPKKPRSTPKAKSSHGVPLAGAAAGPPLGVAIVGKAARMPIAVAPDVVPPVDGLVWDAQTITAVTGDPRSYMMARWYPEQKKRKLIIEVRKAKNIESVNIVARWTRLVNESPNTYTQSEIKLWRQSIDGYRPAPIPVGLGDID